MTQIQERIEAVRGRIVELRTNQAQDYAHAVLDEFVGCLPQEVREAFRSINGEEQFRSAISTPTTEYAQSCEDGNVEQHKGKFADNVRQQLLGLIGKNKEQLGLTNDEIAVLKRRIDEIQTKIPDDTQEMIELEGERALLGKQLDEKRTEKKTLETKVETLETQLTEADGLVEGLRPEIPPSRNITGQAKNTNIPGQASPGEERGPVRGSSGERKLPPEPPTQPSMR